MKQTRVKKMVTAQWARTLDRIPVNCEELIKAYKSMLAK